MSQSKHPIPGLGNAQALWPGYWNMFNAYASAMEPALRNAARVNCELSSLAGQRASAYLTIPERVSRCRTPLDLMQAQAAFWQEAQRQYAETTERVMSVWRSASEAALEQAGNFPEPRDFITFPEPASEDERSSAYGAGNRRAA